MGRCGDREEVGTGRKSDWLAVRRMYIEEEGGVTLLRFESYSKTLPPILKGSLAFFFQQDNGVWEISREGGSAPTETLVALASFSLAFTLVVYLGIYPIYAMLCYVFLRWYRLLMCRLEWFSIG